MKLYELTSDYADMESELDHLVSADTSEDATTIELTLRERLAAIGGQIEAKAENIGKLILSLSADTEGIKAEQERLATRRRSTENKAAWLRAYLLAELTSLGLDKIKRDVLTISVRTNNPSINVVNEDAIPQEWRRVIPETWEPDKKAMLEHIKATGELIAGVEYIKDKKRLEVR